MYQALNKFGPIISLVTIATVPFLSWKNNLKQYEQIRQRINKPIVDYELPRHQNSYPWTQNINDWEGTKIKMEGYFEEQRFLISREKDGKKGYLVFAPFVYRHNIPNNLDKNGKTTREFVIVNLGWIPLHLKDSISMNYDQTNLIQYSEETYPGFLKVNDGFERNPQSQSNYMPLTYVNGIIRKGETKDITRGLNNWPSRNYFRMIDLLKIAQTFRLPNMDKVSRAYVQLIAETQQQRQNIPIANTVQDIEQQYAASQVPYFKWLRENVVSPLCDVAGKIIV